MNDLDEFLALLIEEQKENPIKKVIKEPLTMIQKSDLILLSKTKSGKHPFLDIPNLVERMKVIYDKTRQEFDMIEINSSNTNDLFTKEHWRQGSICQLKYPKALVKYFSREEIAQILLTNPYTNNSQMKEYFEDDKVMDFLDNIRMSIFHNGYNSSDWNEVVEFNNKCVSFNPFEDNDKIEVGFDVTSYSGNSHGYTKYTKHPEHIGILDEEGYELEDRNYIDGEIGFIFSYRGKESFIVSVDVLKDKVIHIKQVQSLIKKRNKMRFSLGDDFFEKIILEFVKHFDTYTIRLVTGEGSVKNITESGKDIKKVDNEAYKRIMTTYNQDFKDIIRGEFKTSKMSVRAFEPSVDIVFQELTI